MSDEQSPQSKLAALLGGELMDVPTNDGETERLKVCILPLRLLLDYIELCIESDGQGIIELCCNLPMHGADKYTADVQMDLLAKAKTLNFTRAVLYLESMKEDSKKLAPLYEKVAKQMINQVQPLMKLWAASLMPPPTPASPSASPESKSSTSPSPGSDTFSPENTPPTPDAPSND